MDNNTINWVDFYNDFSPKLLGICRRYIKDVATVEDIVQDSFIVAIQKENTIKNKNAVKGWITKIVINMALHHIKNGKKAQFVSAEIIDYEYESEKQDMLDIETKSAILTSELTKEDILEAIDQLPKHHKAVFNLYVIDKFSHIEISELLNISVGTSKSHLSRARKSMQNILHEKIKTSKTKESKKKYLLLLLLGFENVMFGNYYSKHFQNFVIQPSKPFSIKRHINASQIPNAFIGLSQAISVWKPILYFGFAFIVVGFLTYMYNNNTVNNDIQKDLPKTEIKIKENQNKKKLNQETIINNKGREKKIDSNTNLNIKELKKTKIVQVSKNEKTATSKTIDSIKTTEIPKVVIIKKKIIKRDTIYVTK